MTEITPEQPLPVRAYDVLGKGGGYLQSVVLLIARAAWGWEAYLSGYRHFQNFSDAVDLFKELHIPFPTFNVYVSATTEMVGGMMLLIGFASRLIAIPLVFNFAVAILTAGSDKVKQALLGGDHFRRYSAGHLGGWEAVVDDTAFPFFVTALLVLAFGPGRFSVDYLLRRFAFKRHFAPENPRRGSEVDRTVDRPPSPQ